MLTGSWERLLQPGSNGQTVNCCSAKEGEHVFAPCPIKQALLLSITLLVAVLFVQVEEVTEQNSLYVGFRLFLLPTHKLHIHSAVST